MASVNESGSDAAGLGRHPQDRGPARTEPEASRRTEDSGPDATEWASVEPPGDDGTTGNSGADGLASSVARIETQDGRTAGTGFIVAPGALLTCAHVVALTGEGPGGTVRLVFPHLPGAPHTAAHVLPDGWRAPDAEDIAVLILVGEGPPCGQPVRLGSAAGSQGHGVRSFGFPAQAPPGGHSAMVGPGICCPLGAGRRLCCS
ncbi:trypsin-like peptidase domain-containing protein [Streptomyces roseifaciens]